jgi:Xaa-Pro aminopeptidase
MRDRVRRIFRHLSEPADALIVANSEEPQLDSSFFYLFDVPSGSFEGAVLIARPDGSQTLLSSQLEAESARGAAEKDPSVEVEVCRGSEDQVEAVQRLLEGKGTVALNFRELTEEGYGELKNAMPKIRWIDASDAIQRTRRVKDAGEIARIEAAGAIVSKVAEQIPSMLRHGISEIDLAGEIEHQMALEGSAGRSFATIVGFGPHSAEPHFSPGGLRLESGQSIVCDFGALHRRYVSDLTRSYHFGPPDPELVRVHATVAEAQAAALAVLRPGVRACDVHQAAQDVIDRSPWRGRFTHRLGHSIGLTVHDGFSLNAQTTDEMLVGETVTVEPGIYLPGKGGVRIEDDVLLTERGYRLLTTASRAYRGPTG